jgi:type II secretory pathway pseudopilin PulG
MAEILVVICIIGILAAIAVPSLVGKVKGDAKDQEVDRTVRSVQFEVERWKKENKNRLSEPTPESGNKATIPDGITVKVAPKAGNVNGAPVPFDYTVTGWGSNGTYTEEEPFRYDSSEGGWNDPTK